MGIFSVDGYPGTLLQSVLVGLCQAWSGCQGCFLACVDGRRSRAAGPASMGPRHP